MRSPRPLVRQLRSLERRVSDGGIEGGNEIAAEALRGAADLLEATFDRCRDCELCRAREAISMKVAAKARRARR